MLQQMEPLGWGVVSLLHNNILCTCIVTVIALETSCAIRYASAVPLKTSSFGEILAGRSNTNYA